MHHVDTLEHLARFHVEARVREAAHEAQLRLAREATTTAQKRPSGAPGALQWIRRAVALRAFVAGRAG